MQPSSEKRLPACGAVAAAAADLCLAFANTRAWRGRAAPSESLNSFQDLLRWCAGAGLATEGRRWAGGGEGNGAEILAEAIALREVIYRLSSRLSAGARLAPADILALNRALARAPERSGIVHRGGRYLWQVRAAAGEDGGMVPTLLAPVLWSAADLIVGAGAHRVRQCANDSCRWLFLDASRNGARRWCDMRACGNQAKARRHYQKVKRAST